MTTATIYAIEQTDVRDQLHVGGVARVDLAASYTSMVVLEAGRDLILLGYQKESGRTDSYVLTDHDPWVAPVDNGLHFGESWDTLSPFYMANQPHMCCYQSKNGHLYFFPIRRGLRTAPPLHFYHTRYPLTTDLTEVKTLVSQGQVFVLGYNGANGYVNIWYNYYSWGRNFIVDRYTF